ncbi:leucine-rich repeat domain-containing protein [Leptospira sp. WS58.C1]|uniref:leucine-rich repeat domain-containing protein n=1 Tax=Leptospira cinconiae TaxID=3235173 RepID=UPI00349E734B
MKHHFIDFLDRKGGYWKMVPNRDRYQYDITNIQEGDRKVSIIKYGKENKDWRKVFSFPNIEEVTLHEPDSEQLESLCKLQSLKRLRISFVKLKDLNFLSSVKKLEELVLEYTSGFSDLSPLSELQKLRSLHLENLRRVSDFSGLNGLKKLKYLYIDGTLDWSQPIDDFEFLAELQDLEVLAFGRILNKLPFPSLLPIVKLRKLKRIKIPSNILDVREFAFIEVCFPKVEGAIRSPFSKIAYSDIFLPKTDFRASLSDDDIRKYHPEVQIDYKGKRKIADPNSEWFEFLGKSAGRVKCNNPSSVEKCNEYAAKYESLKKEALAIIQKAR